MMKGKFLFLLVPLFLLFNPDQSKAQTVCVITNDTIDACPGDTVVIFGVPYWYSALVSDTFTVSPTCDSVSVVHLIYHSWYFFFVSDSICPGDSVYGGGQWRYTPQFYYDTLQTVWGCDSILGVTLTYKDSVHYKSDVYLCPGDSVWAGGAWRDSAGIYYDTILSPFVCDSFKVTKVFEVPDYYTYDTAQICLGDSIFLGGGYQTVPGTYIDSLQSIHGCDSTVETWLIVNPLPVVSANASSTTLCIGDTLILYGTGTADFYVWSDSVTDSVAFLPSATNTYKVEGYFSTTGCADSDFIQVTVNALPVVDAGANDTICYGQSVVLAGSGALTYQWSDSVFDGVAFYPTTAKTYYVTGTDANFCENTDSVYIGIDTLPFVGMTVSSNDVCAGDTVEFTGIGDATFMWDPGNVVGDTFYLNPLTTTTVQLIGTDGNGCSDTVYALIVVYPLPVFTVTASAATICQGESVTLTASGQSLVFQWDNGVGNGVPFAPVAGTMYHVTATDTNTCQSDDSIFVAVDTVPVFAIAASDTLVCQGDSVTLSGTGSGLTFVWDNGITDGVSFVPQATTIYSVTATDGNLCQSTDSIEVAVLPLPVFGISASDTAVCDGDSVTLSGTGSGLTFVWDNGITDGVSFVPQTTTIYSVTATDGNLCQSTDSIEVAVLPLPQVMLDPFTPDTVCHDNESIPLPQATPAGGTYTGQGVFPPLFKPNTLPGPGDYKVYYTYTDDHGCSSSDSSVILVVVCSGVHETTSVYDVAIYPNPFGDYLKMKNSHLSELTFEVFGMDGKALTRGILKPGAILQLPTGEWPPGIFIIRFEGDAGSRVVKVIKR